MLPHNKTNQEVELLTIIVAEAMKSMNTYGRKPEDLSSIVATFCFVLDDCSITQIMEAFRQWMKKSKDFPAPADIRAIVFPSKPEISMAEYIQACDYQKRNGYPYGRYRDLIQEYEAERDAEREGWQKRQDEELAAIKQHGPAMLEKSEDFDDE